ALKENSHPRKPKGPDRESKRYSARPTTTEGSARAVFSRVSTAPRPWKRTTASQAPVSRPMQHARRQAHALTARDRPTICRNAGSSEVIRLNAVEALWDNVFICNILRLF